MAAITPSNLYIENAGSLTFYIAEFPDSTDNGDTWASGATGIVSVMACTADNPATQTNVGAGAALTTASTGTITLYTGENNGKITVWIMARA